MQGGFLFSGRQEPRLAGGGVGRELGAVRAACARQEAAAAWMDTRGDAVAAPAPPAPAQGRAALGSIWRG